jgi:hypothetical protein
MNGHGGIEDEGVELAVYQCGGEAISTGVAIMAPVLV